MKINHKTGEIAYHSLILKKEGGLKYIQHPFRMSNKQPKEKKQYSGSSICGGVISDSMHSKNMRRSIWGDMMCYRLPDKQYNRYVTFRKSGKEKEASKVFDKYAYDPLA